MKENSSAGGENAIRRKFARTINNGMHGEGRPGIKKTKVSTASKQQAKQTYLRERRGKLHQQRSRRRRYHWKNRDRINAKVKQKRLANPGRFRAIDRARYWRNPEKRRHQARVARAKRTGSPCYLNLEGWKNLLRRFRFRCFYCSVKLTKKNRSLDHKIPLVRGGTNDIANLVPSCLRCNQRKNVQLASEFQRAFQ